MLGTIWKSHLSHTFEVLRVWRENGIDWVNVKQHGGAFDGETFKWAVESLLLGGFEKLSIPRGWESI